MEKSKQSDSELAQAKGAAHEGIVNGSVVDRLSPPVFQLRAQGNNSKSKGNLNQESKEELPGIQSNREDFDIPSDNSDPAQLRHNPAESHKIPFQLKEKANNTGMPDGLKSGIESLSGFSMDDVDVHFNSDKPAQLHAHAFAQGSNIHIAPGQEKYLPHEAWHVVQQKQGRVQPTNQLKSKVSVNDDAGLEHEADIMGGRALHYAGLTEAPENLQMKSVSSNTAQLARTEEQLKNKIGAPKFKKIKEANLIEKFIDETNVRLAELKLMPHNEFDELLHEMKTAWLDRDDDFEEESSPQSWLGWGLSKLGFGNDDEGEGDIAERSFKEGHRGNNYTTEQSLTDEEAERVVKDKDDEDEGSLLDKGLKMITINIVDGDLINKREGDFGPGKYEASGKKSLEASVEGVKGKVEIEAQFGKGTKKLKGSGTVGGKDTNLNFGGTLEGFGGLKGGASGEAEINPAEGSAKIKGKAGLSAGVSAEGTVQVLLKAKGKEIGKAQLKGGLMAGLAGEISGIFKFSGGEFVLATGGKAALGLGFTWNYKIVANTSLLGAVGDSISSWASWGKQKIFG